jgi:hypothetical protein
VIYANQPARTEAGWIAQHDNNQQIEENARVFNMNPGTTTCLDKKE